MGLLSNLAGRDTGERPASIPLPSRALPMQGVSETAASVGRERGARHLPVFLVTESASDHGASATD